MKQTQQRAPGEGQAINLYYLELKTVKWESLLARNRGFRQSRNIKEKIEYTSCGSTDTPCTEIQCLQVRAGVPPSTWKRPACAMNFNSLKDSVRYCPNDVHWPLTNMHKQLITYCLKMNAESKRALHFLVL